MLGVKGGLSPLPRKLELQLQRDSVIQKHRTAFPSFGEREDDREELVKQKDVQIKKFEKALEDKKLNRVVLEDKQPDKQPDRVVAPPPSYVSTGPPTRRRRVDGGTGSTTSARSSEEDIG